MRKISYSVPGTDTLTISVNGVPVFIRGGDWGLDEAMKRIPRERLDAQIHMHQLANLNMIRNWVGQSTSEDFYELCDKYGILVWDEFFQPNPGDGPNPTDIDTYIANVRDKILRFRNHPSIALWCARNEGFPPPEIDAALRKLMAELEPTRRYQPSSTDGAGVRSSGPYCWRTPREFYTVTDDYFKTETGSVSRAHARIHPRHDAQEGLGDRSTTTGPSTIWPRAHPAETCIPACSPPATETSPTSPTSCAKRNSPTTRPSAPCTRAATRRSSIPPRPSLPG